VPSGPKRGQLTRGESVTVKVKVDGQLVERVVRPEECVGESETPVVRACQINSSMKYLIDLFISSAGSFDSRYPIKSAYPLSVIGLRKFPFLRKVPINPTRKSQRICCSVRLPHLWRWCIGRRKVHRIYQWLCARCTCEIFLMYLFSGVLISCIFNSILSPLVTTRLTPLHLLVQHLISLDFIS